MGPEDRYSGVDPTSLTDRQRIERLEAQVQDLRDIVLGPEIDPMQAATEAWMARIAAGRQALPPKRRT